jgi:CHAD domain-containing protein
VAGAFGRARDSDVFLAYLLHNAAHAPESHRPFMDGLVRSEKAVRSRRYLALVRTLGSPSYRTIKTRLYSPPGKPSPSAVAADGKHAGANLADRAPRAIKRRLKRVRQFDRPLAEYTSEDLHALRIACKRVRYAAEFLSDLYPEGLARLTADMKGLQGLLGDVHDADVYAERIRRHRGGRRARGSARGDANAAARLLSGLQQWRDDSLAKAARVMRRVTRHRRMKQTLAEVAAPRRPPERSPA